MGELPCMSTYSIWSLGAFLIFDSTQNGYQFLLKEAAYIWWESTTLNNELKNAELAFLF